MVEWPPPGRCTDAPCEIYSEKFVLDFYSAVEAHKVDTLLRLLNEYRIDATLLVAASPAAQVLDHVQGWKQLYADETAVIHVRTNQARMNAMPAPERSD